MPRKSYLFIEEVKGNTLSQPEKCTWVLGTTPNSAVCVHKDMHMPYKNGLKIELRLA